VRGGQAQSMTGRGRSNAAATGLGQVEACGHAAGSRTNRAEHTMWKLSNASPPEAILDVLVPPAAGT
jgi:hypothetical protein